MAFTSETHSRHRLRYVSRRAKIVCTLGPATNSEEQIGALIDAGMDVARMNFSHGSHDEHLERITIVREQAALRDKAVGILVDLQGPKIRLETFDHGKTEWLKGQHVVIDTEPGHGEPDHISTTYTGLAGDVKPGDKMLIDDGNIAVEVMTVEGSQVACRVVEGGFVSNHKGINLPGVNVSVPALSEKDVEDLRFGMTHDCDFIALSFVRSPRDIDRVHEIMGEFGRRVPVIAKIEKPEAVDDLDAIVLAFDAIMIARGDLGVEMALESVPLVQKRAIQLARELAKPVIVATQMLESMISNSRPTRAEASDVANAVLDGTDALMLSGETSVGAHPIESVKVMARIIAAAEDQGLHIVQKIRTQPRTRGGAIARAAIDVANAVEAIALVAFTQTGDTVRRLSRHRPSIPLLAFTPLPEIRRQMALSWGVESFESKIVLHTDEMVEQVDIALREMGRGEAGDQVVIVAGSPPNTPGSTNAMRVHRLGYVVGPKVPSAERG